MGKTSGDGALGREASSLWNQLTWCFSWGNQGLSVAADMDPTAALKGLFSSLANLPWQGVDFGQSDSQRGPMPNRCIMCCAEQQTGSHLFMHCSVLWSVWVFFFRHFQVPWVLPESIGAFLHSWSCPRSPLSQSSADLQGNLEGLKFLHLWRDCRG